MPAVRQQAVGMHLLDGHFDGHLPMIGQRDLEVDSRAWREGSLELRAKPGAKLLGVGERAPDTRPGCAQDDLFLYAVGAVMQLHGCTIERRQSKCNPSIAYPPIFTLSPPGCRKARRPFDQQVSRQHPKPRTCTKT